MLAILDPPDSGFFPLFDEERMVDGRIYDCPIDPQHYRGNYRINSLHIILPSTKVPPICWSWASECIITEQTAELFEEAQLSGYTLEPVSVSRIKRVHSSLTQPVPMFVLRPQGWAGVASPLSGITLLSECEGCGRRLYSIPNRPDKILDVSQWDGSDFSIVWPLPAHILVTKRVVEVIKQNKLRQAVITPIAQLRFVYHELAPGFLSDYFDEEKAKRLGGQLGIA